MLGYGRLSFQTCYNYRMKFLLQLLILGCITVTFLVGCSSLNEKQGEWIFSPVRINGGTWGNSAAVASTMEDVWINFDSTNTGKPVKLHALWHASKHKNSPTLLYLHGARWNVTGSASRIARMQELGFNVLAPDYRGFGKTSDEIPSEANAYEDAKAAWDWIGQKHAASAKYIFGHSLGGTIAIELASQVSDEKGTIVEGTFTSVPDVFRTLKWGWLPITSFITQRFDAARKVANIGSPLLVVHGSEDQTIHPELGKKLFDAAVHPKRFLLVEGGSHHNTNAMGQAAYRTALTELFGIAAQSQ
jgi:uncharacterized protein